MEDLSTAGPAAQYHREAIRHEDRVGAVHDAAPAICRICRGEGTPGEPLFYPCKCSGSIKYVHQDCLMEWLSHSQKKYCELCKTPFRFTKLYAPDMPQSLPIHIFVEHMAKYLFRNLLVWLRAAVAVSVWIFWLPYFMRAVWSFMFWISDEGLGSSSMLARTNETASAAATLASSILGIGTCPASPLLAATTTSAAEAEAVMGQLKSQNISDFLIRLLLGTFTVPLVFNRSDANPGSASNMSSTPDANLTTSTSTLLGNVSLLRNLTRSATLNRAILSVLEGQIITVLVIVSFILVILVRDYVVQQQPEINMRAAFAAPENDDLPPHVAEVAQPAPLQDPHESDSDDETLDNGEQAGDQDWQSAAVERPETTDEDRLDLAPSSRPTTNHFQGADEESSEAGAIDSPPGTSADDSNDTPMEERASVIDYLRIYRRANGDSEEILRIVQEEGLQDKLSFWMNVTRRAIKEHDDGNVGERHAALEDRHQSSADSELDSSQSSSQGKGKERALPPTSLDTNAPIPVHTAALHQGQLRPRAMSDSPQEQRLINPLANNSWSFAALPSDSNDDQLRLQLPSVQDPEVPAKNVTYSPISFTEEGASSSSRSRVQDTESSDEILPHRHADMDESERYPDAQIEAPSSHHDQAAEQNAAVDGGEAAAVGLVGQFANFMWGNLNEPQPADLAAERPVGEDDGQEDVWVDVPVGAAADDDDVDAPGVDEDAVAGAAFDAEAIEDLEDFEGVMELIGMRGPIAGLFQNAIFCAVLVSVTIFACIFIPYNIGRVSVWILISPMRLVRVLFELSKLLQDVTILLGGLGSWCALNLIDMFTGVIGGAIGAQVVAARKMSWGLWTSAGTRVLGYVFMDFPMSASEIQNFSAISHEALNAVKDNVASVVSTIDGGLNSIYGGGLGGLLAAVVAVSDSVLKTSISLSSLFMNPSSWVIDLSEPEERPPINHELAYWSSLDRLWAILAGYITVFFIGAMYLKRGSPFSRGTVMHAWEAGIIDTLQQASGIMKVILIISIEMLVFPLYCGLLLDAALLPLFEDTTLKSRMLFTYNYPMTSVFVHWFVGTGYMFHFALFVSMCRKIMRPGVLYFIRDPDDPEFHPVRDVLERNLTTQLRKILFSAFVYGALVIVCLGGVVWGLSFTIPGVLPIHYSSNEPVLEFPVDLLFYNFLMPLAVKFFKPSDAIHTMYTWWFRKCARGLRLTYFLFGERRIDEEGTLQLPPGSMNGVFPHLGVLLELDEGNTVIPKTWRDTFEGGDAKPNPALSSGEMRSLRHKKSALVGSEQLVQSGRFVRAPASDRVKIPKGQKVFLTVSERGHRKDGHADDDLYASDQYQLVYVPPNFRTRVFLFILFIWVFAAVTGVGFTIIPLVFGRKVFKVLIPEHIRTNDIYAFSIGVFVLGSIAYSAVHAHSMRSKVQGWVNQARGDIVGGNAAGQVGGVGLRMAKLFYAYFFLLIVFPLLASTMMELYLTIPLHTYLYPPTAPSTTQDDHAADRHTVRVIQAWTLGLLYVKLASRMITSMFPDSRAAMAVRSIMRRGWLRPDIGTLTRAFVIPGLATSAVAIFGPPMVASFVIKHGGLVGGQALGEAAEVVRLTVIYRQSYPAAAFAALLAKNAVGFVKVMNRWTAGVRDEAYLIGERLHNFGAGAGARKGRGAWGGRRPRL